MITKRTVALVVGAAALAAWLAAAATSAVRPMRAVVTPRPAIDVRGAALTAEIERLHERLKPTATPEHSRNLFEFAHTRSAVASAPVSAPPVNDVAASVPPAPVEPPFKLIGVAEDNNVRTAILSTPTQVLLVRDGETVAPAYRVTGISADTVILISTMDGAVLRLTLK